MFEPDVGYPIFIGGYSRRVTEHPAARGSGIPYGQTGRAGTVYQLVDDAGNFRALKVFSPYFRQPSLAGLAEKLRPFAKLPGLSVCDRVILIPQQHGALLRENPDLLYAVVMPWITGQTWHEVMSQQTLLTPEQSLALARAFISVQLNMEQQGVAHGDLSGPNLIIDGLGAEGIRVELVDVEQLYAPGLVRPDNMPGGSPGYAAHRSGAGLWQADMDRFAGAVMLAEILGWCDERMRAAAWGETYFAEDEMQQDGERYRTARAVLAERWGPDVAALFGRAWAGNSLADCPPFGAWQLAMPEAGASAAAVSVQPLSPAESRSAPLPGQAEIIDGTLPRSPEEKEELLLALAMATELIQWGRAAELYEYLLAGWPEDPGRHQWEEGLERAIKQGQAAGQGSGLRRFAPVFVVVAVLVMAGIYFVINPPGSDPPATPPPSSTVLVVSGVTATTAAPSRTAKPTATQRIPATSTARVVVAPTATSKPANKVLYFDWCDPRTDPDFCQIGSNLEVLQDFYNVFDAIGLDLEYGYLDVESDSWKDYAVIIVPFCGHWGEQQMFAGLREYVSQGGSVIAIANNACFQEFDGEEHSAAAVADSFTRDYGIRYSEEDLANDDHTFAAPATTHPLATQVDSLYQYRYTVLEVDSPAMTLFTQNDRPVVALYDGADGTVVALTANLEWGPSPTENAETAERLNDPGFLSHMQTIDEHKEQSDNFVFWENLLRWMQERSGLKQRAGN